MKNIKTASLEELRAMRASGAIKPTRPDAPELDVPEGFWDTAKLKDTTPSYTSEIGDDVTVKGLSTHRNC